MLDGKAHTPSSWPRSGWRRALLGLASVTVMALAMGAASTATVQAAAPPQVRLAYFSPDGPSVDLYVDGRRTLSNVAYKTLTDYRPLSPGRHSLQVRPRGRASSRSGPPTLTEQLAAGSHHTLVVGGRFTQPAQLFLTDGRTTPPQGKALLRVFSLAPGLATLDCSVKGAPVVFESLRFNQVRGYQPVSSGRLQLICDRTGSGQPFLATGDVSLRAGSVDSLVGIGGINGRPLEFVQLSDAAAAPATGGAATGEGGGVLPVWAEVVVLRWLLLVVVLGICSMRTPWARRRTKS